MLCLALLKLQCFLGNCASKEHKVKIRIFSVSKVRVLGGIPALVLLFTSDSVEVQRYATAATRNLIYENTDNKAALIQAGGLTPLVNILNQPDEELQKTITGGNRA